MTKKESDDILSQEQAQISVLKYPDNVRLRKGMYLPSKTHCIYEIVDNSVDEFSAGRCSTIYVFIVGDEVTVVDNGGGIPITPSDSPGYEGKPQVEVAMTVLHAGGKFGDEKGYQTNTGGLNGIIPMPFLNLFNCWKSCKKRQSAANHP